MDISVLLVSLISTLAPASASLPDCGGAVACQVQDGNYRIEIPKDGDVRGAYLFFHGYKGSALLQMEQRDLVNTTLAHHLAFVAIDGLHGSWTFPNDARDGGRDDNKLVADVFNDLHARFGFSAKNTIIGGFSIGASMAYYTACKKGQKAAAMLTFSGVFWNPLPKSEDCVAGIPPSIHFHGTADGTFPLAGRQVSPTARQGDTFKSVAVLREAGKCDLDDAKTVIIDGITCQEVPDCLRGDNILCIHAGGHEARADMLDAGLTTVGFPR